MGGVGPADAGRRGLDGPWAGPGSTVDQYAQADIPFYWDIEQAATGVPIVYTYVLGRTNRA